MSQENHHETHREPDHEPHREPHREPYVARTAEDLLASVPIVLGFQPHESLVMLTFGRPSSFHARVDLPTGPEQVDEVVRSLHEPAVRHRVAQALLVVYADDSLLVRRTVRTLRTALEASGVHVLDALRAHGGRWWPATGGRSGGTDPGVPFDAVSHPFRARSVLEGTVTLGSRAEVAARLAPDPAAVARVDAVARPVPAAPRLEEVLAVLAARHEGEGAPGDVEAALVARVLVEQPVLVGVVLLGMERAAAAAEVDWWSALVRRTPGRWVPGVGTVAGFAAWLSGSGALAWCAVDRVRAVQPDHPFAGLLADVLARALPPSSWDAVAGDLGRLAGLARRAHPSGVATEAGRPD